MYQIHCYVFTQNNKHYLSPSIFLLTTLGIQRPPLAEKK